MASTEPEDRDEVTEEAPRIDAVLKPGDIAARDDEITWGRTLAILGGVVVISLGALGVVSFLGRNTPPKAPMTHDPPTVMTALDLDEVPGDALAKPVKIPGAGAKIPDPAQPTKVAQAVGKKGKGRGKGRRAGAKKPEAPQPPAAERRKPSSAIIYRPAGPE